MYQTRERVYYYHGYALGFGGFVGTDGERQNIDSIASTVLSVAGGAGHARQTGYCFFRCGKNNEPNFYVRIEEAFSEVVGYETADGYTTRSRSTLHGLDINGVVKADVVESSLESHHAGAACANKEEPQISVLNSRFEGLTIAGVEVTPHRSEVFDCLPTYEGLRGFVDGTQVDDRTRELRPGFRAASLMDVDQNAPPYVADLCHRYVSSHIIRCSIFDALETGGALDTHGYSVAVPDFGRVFLGELLVTKGMKRLNMIRFDLGCVYTGGGTGGGSSVNGEPTP